jgi:DNA-binding transcriptional LysR family regulator
VRGKWFTDIVAPAIKQAGVELSIRFEVSGRATILELVRAGLAVAFVTLSSVDRSLPVAKVIEPEIHRTLGWLEPAAPQAHAALDELKVAIRTHLEH